MRRTNFFADLVSDVSRPGVRSIIDRVSASGELAPLAFVDTCLDLMGPLDVDEPTRANLVAHAELEGPLRWVSPKDTESSTKRVAEMLQLVVSLREYQFA